MQICSMNGSLEEFDKYIYRNPVEWELWRRNVLNTIMFTEWRPGMSRMTECKHRYIYQVMARKFEDKMAFLNTILLTELILRTYRTTERKHKYIHQMMARNFDDKTTLLNTNFTHGINTENVQDSREETHVQIYLPNDSQESWRGEKCRSSSCNFSFFEKVTHAN